MSQNICDCHCGTRIDLDEQLLQERQMWKQKYLCLQKQVKIDIQTLKDNIYAECAGIMQQQFSQKEIQNNKIINSKNVQIKDLIARVINLQTQVKVLTKQKQILSNKYNQLERQISERDQIISNLKSRSAKGIRDWELKHQQQIINLKQNLNLKSKEQLQKGQAQKQILKQKLKQFQIKYQKIIPEVEKIRNCLNAKTTQNQQLLSTIQKMKKKSQQDLQKLNDKFEDLSKIHNTCSKQIKQLSDQNQGLYRQLDKSKKINKEVKVQAVYIDRPVQVQKVVQKIVQVQKIVNKYIDNPMNDKKFKVLEDENKKLKEQLNNLLRQIKDVQEHYQKAISGMEDNMKEYERNILLYKKQRQNLANKIGQQNKQLQLLHNFIQKLGAQRSSSKCQGQNEKIVVHVKQDGTYQKTVQKLPRPPANSNQRKKK